MHSQLKFSCGLLEMSHRNLLIQCTFKIFLIFYEHSALVLYPSSFSCNFCLGLIPQSPLHIILAASPAMSGEGDPPISALPPSSRVPTVAHPKILGFIPPSLFALGVDDGLCLHQRQVSTTWRFAPPPLRYSRAPFGIQEFHKDFAEIFLEIF